MALAALASLSTCQRSIVAAGLMEYPVSWLPPSTGLRNAASHAVDLCWDLARGRRTDAAILEDDLLGVGKTPPTFAEVYQLGPTLTTSERWAAAMIRESILGIAFHKLPEEDVLPYSGQFRSPAEHLGSWCVARAFITEADLGNLVSEVDRIVGLHRAERVTFVSAMTTLGIAP